MFAMAFRSRCSSLSPERFAAGPDVVLSDLGGLGKIMPLAGFAFGIATFAAIGLPGFANFPRGGWSSSARSRRGELQGFHIFQIATVLALWGVVISAVYMLRAYRAVFMGSPNPERVRGGVAFPDLSRALRLPISCSSPRLYVGFFPNTVLRLLRGLFAAHCRDDR